MKTRGGIRCSGSKGLNEINSNKSTSKLSNIKVKHIDTKQSNKRNNQNTKDKRQDYNRK